MKWEPLRVTDLAAVAVRISTLASWAAVVRQSMMVWEESVVGNMRPSASVLSPTPREANQSMVSVADQRWRGPMSDLWPRGIVGGERLWLEAGVGDIAAAAAGNFYFGQDVVGLFEDQDAGVGAEVFGGVDGGEEAGGAATDDDEVVGGFRDDVRSVGFLRCCPRWILGMWVVSERAVR